MDKIYEIDPNLIRSYLPKMMELIPELSNESKIRQFLKIISLEPIPANTSGLFISSCFDLLMNRSTAVAIRIHAMTVLYHFSLIETDIQNELAIVLEELMTESSAGFQCRAKRILKKLHS